MCLSENTLVSCLAQRGKNDLSCFIGKNLGYICKRLDCCLYNVSLKDLCFNTVSHNVSEEDMAVSSAVTELVNCADGIVDIATVNMDSLNTLITQLTAE